MTEQTTSTTTRVLVTPAGDLHVERYGRWWFVCFEPDGNHWITGSEGPDGGEVEYEPATEHEQRADLLRRQVDDLTRELGGLADRITVALQLHACTPEGHCRDCCHGGSAVPWPCPTALRLTTETR
jgi:hypothetical protein